MKPRDAIMLRMDEVATKEDIDELRREFNGRLNGSFESIASQLRTFMQHFNDRFDVIERDISELKESHNHLLDKIDNFAINNDR